MTKQKHSTSFKAKVALEAIKGMETIAAIAAKYQVHPNCVIAWKTAALKNFSCLFDSSVPQKSSSEEHVAALERKVGQLAVENDFLKKSWDSVTKKSGKK
jgi:transposase